MNEAERLAREWLERAGENLATAEVVLASSSLAPRIAAWHAQQAVEKAIKAVLVVDQIEFPFTHDLAALHALLQRRLRAVAGSDLASLSRYAVEARYPGPWPDTEPDDAQAAVIVARAVVDEIGERFEGWAGS